MNHRPKLITHVVYGFAVGGLENGIVNLVNRMPHERWRHAIIALTQISGKFADRIERSDVRYIELAKRPGHLVRDYPRLYRLLQQLKPEIVHTRNLAALEAVVPAWAAGVPVRIHGEHGWDTHDPSGLRRRYQYMRRLYRPFVSSYVALSRHLERYLEAQVGVAPQRVTQIYNGVDTERFQPAAGRAPIPGCPFGKEGEWLIGWVGRMEGIKDPLNLAKAFVRAIERSAAAARQWRLVLVGDGSLREPMREVFERAGAADRVWFAGERADVPALMRGFDCFVLPSAGEGISNTVLEAMASGLPVVATRVGGNVELIEPGMTGALVPAASPHALAEALLQYFGDRPLARRHGKAARRAAESRFSLARMVADYSRLYENALAEAGIPVPPARPAALAPR